MPKQRQIPCLFGQRLASGETAWHWKPSAALRRAGFVNQRLGVDQALASVRAIELNTAVAIWRQGGQPAAGGSPPIGRTPPRVVRFDELVRRYRASTDFTGLRSSTRNEYGTRLRQLELWALDGKLAVRDIDTQAVRDLRNELVAHSSPFRAASILRVLRMLLGWAQDESIVTLNAATECDIPEPPSRRIQMTARVRAAVIEAAVALGIDVVPLAIDLGLWLIQRQADVRHLNRMAWREIETAELDLAPRHLAALVDARGRVMSFRLAQQKTGTWIDAPVPPFLHDRVEAALRTTNGGYVFPHPDDPDQPIPAKTFQRRFAQAKGAAWAVALMDGDTALAGAIDAAQFRDLRRTGMIFYKDMGAKLPDITALSGHCVLGKKTILDTYMPGDTAGACACVATGLLGMRAREKREKTG